MSAATATSITSTGLRAKVVALKATVKAKLSSKDVGEHSTTRFTKGSSTSDTSSKGASLFTSGSSNEESAIPKSTTRLQPQQRDSAHSTETASALSSSDTSSPSSSAGKGHLQSTSNSKKPGWLKKFLRPKRAHKEKSAAVVAPRSARATIGGPMKLQPTKNGRLAPPSTQRPGSQAPSAVSTLTYNARYSATPPQLVFGADCVRLQTTIVKTRSRYVRPMSLWDKIDEAFPWTEAPSPCPELAFFHVKPLPVGEAQEWMDAYALWRYSFPREIELEVAHGERNLAASRSGTVSGTSYRTVGTIPDDGEYEWRQSSGHWSQSSDASSAGSSA